MYLFKKNIVCLFVILVAFSYVKASVSRTINITNGREFSRDIFGINSNFSRSDYHESEPASSRFGGGGGGIYSSTYNWKTGISYDYTLDQTVFEFLNKIDSIQATPVMLVNWKGIIAQEGGAFTDTSGATMSTLAADLVTYCNKIACAYHENDILPSEYQSLLNELQWNGRRILAESDELLPHGVKYWMIGNEPANGCVEGGGIPCSTNSGNLNYKEKFNAITTSMFDVDPTIKVGLGAHLASDCVQQVFQDSNCHFDFLAWHIYPELGLDNFDLANDRNLSTALSGIRSYLWTSYQSVTEFLTVNNRNPDNYEYFITEWNPCCYSTTGGQRSMFQALAVAETLFTFMDIGVDCACFWSHLSDDTTKTLYPSYYVMNELRKNAGDTLIDKYIGTNLRIYTTRDSKSGKVAVWVLNLNESGSSQSVTLNLRQLDFVPLTVTQMSLGKVSGNDDPLDASNTPNGACDVAWSGGRLDLDTFNISSHTITSLPGTMMMLTLKGSMSEDVKAEGIIDVFEHCRNISETVPYDLNQSGQAVGYYKLQTGRDGYSYTDQWAFCYGDTGFTTPYGYPINTKNRIFGINNAGVAVGLRQGWGGTPTYGAVYDSKTGGWIIENMGSNITPLKINDNGLVAGYYANDGSDKAFVYNIATDTYTDLYLTLAPGQPSMTWSGGDVFVHCFSNDDVVIATGINSSQDVRGVFYRYGASDGGWILFDNINGNPDSTALYYVNDNGVAAGYNDHHPVVTSDITTPDVDDIVVYQLDCWEVSGCPVETFAYCVNNSGVIVGAAQLSGSFTSSNIKGGSVGQLAVIWSSKDDEPVAINDLLENGCGWNIQRALRINDSGVILAAGLSPDNKQSVVLLYPSQLIYQSTTDNMDDTDLWNLTGGDTTYCFGADSGDPILYNDPITTDTSGYDSTLQHTKGADTIWWSYMLSNGLGFDKFEITGLGSYDSDALELAISISSDRGRSWQAVDVPSSCTGLAASTNWGGKYLSYDFEGLSILPNAVKIEVDNSSASASGQSARVNTCKITTASTISETVVDNLDDTSLWYSYGGCSTLFQAAANNPVILNDPITTDFEGYDSQLRHIKGDPTLWWVYRSAEGLGFNEIEITKLGSYGYYAAVVVIRVSYDGGRSWYTIDSPYKTQNLTVDIAGWGSQYLAYDLSEGMVLPNAIMVRINNASNAAAGLSSRLNTVKLNVASTKPLLPVLSQTTTDNMNDNRYWHDFGGDLSFKFVGDAYSPVIYNDPLTTSISDYDYTLRHIKGEEPLWWTYCADSGCKIGKFEITRLGSYGYYASNVVVSTSTDNGITWQNAALTDTSTLSVSMTGWSSQYMEYDFSSLPILPDMVKIQFTSAVNAAPGESALINTAKITILD